MTKRQKVTTVLVITLSVMAILAVFSFFSRNNKQTRKAEISLYQRFLSAEAKSLGNHFNHLQGIARMMAHNPIILKILESGYPVDSSGDAWADLAGTVNANLSSLAGISDISAAFIMNKDGLCILSSATKFIGKNYGFRPYFKQALENGFGLYAARGVTSGKIGIYYSVAMYSDSRITGVAVLKFSPSFFHVAALPALNRNAGNSDGEILGLAFDDGIFIIPATGKICSLAPLAASKRERLAASRQFGENVGNAGFPPTTWRQLQKQGYAYAVRNPEQKRYHLFMKPVVQKKIYLLHIIPDAWFNTAYTPLSQSQQNLFNVLYGLVAILILAIIIMVYYHYKYRQLYDRLLKEQTDHNLALGFYQQIINSAPIGFWQVDPASKTVKTVNNAFCEMIQLPKEEIVGRQVFDFYTDSALPELKAHARNIAENQHCTFQSQLKKHGGGFVSVVQYSQLADDPQSGTKQRFAFFTDISSTIQQKEELKLMVTALEQSDSTIVITDSDGTIKYVNQAMVNISGYSREECLGQNPRILKSGNHDAAFYKDMWATLLAGKTWRGRISNRNKSGDLYWEEAIISPVFDQNERITHYIAIKTEITRQIEMEKELQDALNKANSINQLKSKFLATMSHEIRTPMNAIIGMSRLALDSGLHGRQYELVSSVHSAAQSLLTLLNDILDFSKIEAGQLAVDPQPFSLFGLLDSIEKTMAVLVKEKNLDFIVDADLKHLPEFIVADELRLRQVIINLINNAVKFTRQGSITLKVSSQETNAGITLSFAVIDTGIGIPREKQRVIFDSFTQGDSSTAREYGGTGLGLSISKQLVELMGGEIGLRSEPGKGSTFFFTLPVTVVSGQDIRHDTRRVTQIARNLHILVVDDNDMNLDLAKMILEQYDHHVVLAHDGVQALEILSDEDFDLVFMDVQMPVMDGFAATGIIRKIEQGKAEIDDISQQLAARLKKRLAGGHLTIIAMTANAMKGDKEKCLAAGMDSYLTKPLLSEDIIRAINGLSLSAGALVREPENSSGNSAEKAARLQLVADFMKKNYDLPDKSIERIIKRAPQTLKDNFSRLNKAVDADDLVEISEAAHKLKGSLLTFGLDELGQKAAEIETAAREKKKVLWREKIDELRQKLDFLF